ncbi:MAG TPA: nickel-responsive transcriptional regulator NikR, partial [Syntrophales bacterium]|nr:nickel-responsive transcriptional regulator NikR [Syntrophales bacterium]
LNYDHHQRDMLGKITDIQHDHQDLIISTQHIHLDHRTCLEIVAVRGKADRVEALAHALRSVKGVKHGALSISGTGREMG